MNAKIIAVFNQKGGCAKTMTAMQVGGALATMGLKTLIIDMDPQGTSAIWSAQADSDTPFPAQVVSLAPMKERMIGEIRKFVNDYDVILIDCPPAIESSVPWAALSIADLGVIPVIPVMDNIWASAKAKALALNAKQENPDLKTYFLASQVRRGRVFSECFKKIEGDPDVPMLKSIISQRNAFPESQVFGATVLDLGRTSDASKEVLALANELLAILELEIAAEVE